MKNDLKKFALLAWIFGAFLVFAGSLTPKFGPPEVFYLDKIIHGSAYAALAFLPFFFTNNRKILLIYIALIIAMGGGIEILQNFIPERSGTIGDFLADFIGSLSGAFVAMRIKPWITRTFN